MVRADTVGIAFGSALLVVSARNRVAAAEVMSRRALPAGQLPDAPGSKSAAPSPTSSGRRLRAVTFLNLEEAVMTNVIVSTGLLRRSRRRLRTTGRSWRGIVQVGNPSGNADPMPVARSH